METGLIDGVSKWSIAVDSLAALTDEFDGSIELGLMMFPDPGITPGECSPGELVVEPALHQRSTFAAALAEPPPEAGNWTPMAETLERAAELPAISGDGRYVVLVTDGWQWCAPYDAGTRFAPVDAVEALKAKGVTTYVVGFGDSVDALTLNMMAESAGTARPGCDSASEVAGPKSCYFQADSPDELHEALRAIALEVSVEICNGIDDDCDGLVDEDLIRDCSSACGAGKESCTAGVWAGCDAPAVSPDICDGLDNDCDGASDPGCECQPGETRTCGGSAGVCAPGTQSCDASGHWADACVGEILPGEELCNGLDDDCDGEIDEGFEGLEICNGVDDDCDGLIDEDIDRTCFSACGPGTETCESGEWVGCDAPPVGVEVCDGVDNDCNGTVDDGCDCLPGDVVPCGESDAGECELGEQECDSSGHWGDCEGATGPSTEICNGLDDDCDGSVDEGEESESSDDVTIVCPRGDDEPPAPAPAEPGSPAGGCSTGGTGGSWILGLGLALFFGRRRRRLA